MPAIFASANTSLEGNPIEPFGRYLRQRFVQRPALAPMPSKHVRDHHVKQLEDELVDTPTCNDQQQPSDREFYCPGNESINRINSV